MSPFIEPAVWNARRILVVSVGSAVVAMTAGVAIGWYAKPADGRAVAAPAPAPTFAGAPAPVTAAAGSLPGAPTRLNNLGIPVGYPHTQAGAISACGNYISAVQDLRTRNAAGLNSIFSAIGTPNSAQSLTNKIVNADKQTAKNFQVSSINDPNFEFDLRVVGYTIQASNQDRVVVSVWSAAGVGVFGRSDNLAPQQHWGTDICTVSWIEGDWKLAAAEDGPDGPAINERPAEGISRFSLVGGSTS